ncbi:MAG TPA: hypothetical protein PK566_18750 [Pseudobacteroides sp.]|nr:hypothetical protein [Pseudobacteroides sp.]
MSKKLKVFLAVFAILALSITSVYAYENMIVDNMYNPIKEYEKINKTELGFKNHKQLVEQKNNKLKQAKIDDVIATITFNNPLSFEKLQNYVNLHGLKLVQIQARAINSNGDRVTIMSKSSKGLVETDRIVNEQSKDQNAEFIGYISLYCLVDSNKIENIENDASTYLIDTSGDLFHAGKKQKNSKERNLSDSIDKKIGKRFPHSLAWDLEDLKNKK